MTMIAIETHTQDFKKTAYWLGYLGLLPVVAGTTLIFFDNQGRLAIDILKFYTAVILTFIGAIHWGRAIMSKNSTLLVVSVAPSLIAYLALFMPAQYALPLMIGSFMLFLYFDRHEYKSLDWFRLLRTRLTAAICTLMTISWISLII
jgi:undecaprenyl pyrophosphate phosphatase UppP